MLKTRVAGAALLVLLAADMFAQSTPIQITADLTEAPRKLYHAEVELPVKAVREQIAGGFDLLVHIARLVDGSRRVTQITEISGMEGDVVTLQDLFVASAPTEEEAGRAKRLLTPLRATGLKPHFLEKLAAHNVVLPPAFFNPDEADVRAAFSIYGGNE